MSANRWEVLDKGKGKGICLESRYLCDYTCSSDFTFPGSGHTAACNYWSNLGSVHQVPIMAGWTEAVWSTLFAQHFYTWPDWVRIPSGSNFSCNAGGLFDYMLNFWLWAALENLLGKYTRYAANEYGGWVKIVIQFRLSHKLRGWPHLKGKQHNKQLYFT